MYHLHQKIILPISTLYNRNVDHNQEPILDGFLLYLYGVVLRDLGNIKHAKLILCESVIAYPLNWSAWLEKKRTFC